MEVMINIPVSELLVALDLDPRDIAAINLEASVNEWRATVQHEIRARIGASARVNVLTTGALTIQIDNRRSGNSDRLSSLGVITDILRDVTADDGCWAYWRDTSDEEIQP